MSFNIPLAAFRGKNIDFWIAAVIWGFIILAGWEFNRLFYTPATFFDSDAALISFFMGYGIIAFWIKQRHSAEFLKKNGVNPYDFHWSKRRRRDGFLFCADCHSTHIVLPEDFDPETFVFCGDCGQKIAPYGEMAQRIDEVRADLTSLRPTDTIKRK